jgi:hypothetical protein
VSITSARNFIEKTGCGLIVAILLGVVMLFGLLIINFSRQEEEKRNEVAREPIATVGGQLVPLSAVENRYRNNAAQVLSIEGGAAPEQDAAVYASSLDEELRMAARRAIAAKQGLKVTDQRILDDAARLFDAEMQYRRMMLAATGQIKQNATEAEAQEALKRAIGRDVAEARKEYLEKTRELLDNPEARAELEANSLTAVLNEGVASKTSLSDEQLKKDLETVVTKRIAFDPFKSPDEDIMAKAKRVLEEISSGRISFEAAMNRYSDDPAPAPGKPKSESTTNLERGTLSYDDAYEPLRTMKPGEVSPVISLPTGPAIFKVIRVDTKLPADFETTKDERRKTRMQQMAVKQVNDDVKQLIETSTTWQSAGFRALHEWYRTQQDPDLNRDKAKLAARLGEIAQTAKKALEDGDGTGNRAANLAYFVTTDKLYDEASGAKKSELRPSWIEAATNVLQDLENVDLRVELARTLLEAKDMEKAADMLALASQYNTGISEGALKRFKEVDALIAKAATAGAKSEQLQAAREAQTQWKTEAYETLKSQSELNEDYTESGRQQWAEINKRLEAFRSAGILSAPQVQEIEGFQKRWVTEKAKADEEIAKERKAAEEEAKKEAEEAKRKANAPEPSGGAASGKAGG